MGNETKISNNRALRFRGVFDLECGPSRAGQTLENRTQEFEQTLDKFLSLSNSTLQTPDNFRKWLKKKPSNSDDDNNCPPSTLSKLLKSRRATLVPLKPRTITVIPQEENRTALPVVAKAPSLTEHLLASAQVYFFVKKVEIKTTDPKVVASALLQSALLVAIGPATLLEEVGATAVGYLRTASLFLRGTTLLGI